MNDITIAVAIRALAWLGLGVNQAANFSLEKIDFKRSEYVLEDTTGHLRLIPIPRNMLALLAKARHLQPNGGPHKRDTSTWISEQSLRDFVRQIGLEVGIQDLTPIQITHGCIFG